MNAVEEAVSAIQLGQDMVSTTFEFLAGALGNDRAFDVLIEEVARLRAADLEVRGTTI